MTRTRRLELALFVSLAVALAEAGGAAAAHSAGLLSAAAHDLGDAGALGLALASVRLAARPATKAHSFGLHRLTILSGLTNAVGVVAVSVLVAVVAGLRLAHPPAVHGGTVALIAAIGLTGNAAAALVLRDRSKDLNMRVASLHLAADAAASAAVVVAGAVIAATGRLAVLDPAVALVVALAVLVRAVLLVRRAVEVLLESTPSDVAVDALVRSLEALPGVVEVHDLHCWSISSELRALSAHAVLAGHPSLEEAQLRGESMKAVLRERHGIAHATLELECEPCADPSDDRCAFSESREPARPASERATQAS